AAHVDEAADCDAQAASRLRPRLARVPVPAEPEDPRLPPPPRARNDPGRRQSVTNPAAGLSRLARVRWTDPRRNGRADGVSAHRPPALLPDAGAVCVVLVHARADNRADRATAGVVRR